MTTTIPNLSSLEHDILEWAINSEIFEEVEGGELSGWTSWDRTGVLTRRQLVIDWETPHIATYAEFILLRLESLSEGANDKYAQASKNLEERIRPALKSKGIAGNELLFKTAGRQASASR